MCTYVVLCTYVAVCVERMHVYVCSFTYVGSCMYFSICNLMYVVTCNYLYVNEHKCTCGVYGFRRVRPKTENLLRCRFYIPTLNTN